jgi:chromatin structure-remodeling complex protein RSC7
MSARITIKPPLRKPPTISVPSRARGSARTPSEGASEPADEDKNGAAMDVDVTRVEDEADDGDGASSSARTLDATPGPEDATPGPGDAPPDPDAPPVKRPRGRPRGTGNPRGRPRGSRGVGRGRGRGRGGAAVRGGDDDERSGTPAEGEEYATSRVETTRAVAGRTYIIDGDELVTDDDPAGDEKIDINGNLLGGEEPSISATVVRR